MKSIPPSIYSTKYYTDVCLGSTEFAKSKGKRLAKEVLDLLSKAEIKKEDTVLDIGCGRGDITIFISKIAKKAVGIDYSQDGISLARNALRTCGKKTQEKTTFYKMNATKLDFPTNSFDKIIAIDVLEHLNKAEVRKMMKEIQRVLKPDGVLFMHTGTNKILYDYTYKYYTLPVNLLIRGVDGVIFKKKYDALPSDPRTQTEKDQHVNEPTIFYLRKLFKNFNFSGEISTRVGYLKPNDKLTHRVYNFICALYPLSQFYPLNIFFGWGYICILKNKKSN